jgi:hypothetical protein
MIKASAIDRIVAVLLGGPGLGGVTSMGVLRLFHEWAFRTEFMSWLRMTALHHAQFLSCLIMVRDYPSECPHCQRYCKLRRRRCGGRFSCVLVPFGFVLLISSQAFIASGVATLAYIAVSALEDNNNSGDPQVRDR